MHLTKLFLEICQRLPCFHVWKDDEFNRGRYHGEGGGSHQCKNAQLQPRMA